MLATALRRRAESLGAQVRCGVAGHVGRGGRRPGGGRAPGRRDDGPGAARRAWPTSRPPRCTAGSWPPTTCRPASSRTSAASSGTTPRSRSTGRSTRRSPGPPTVPASRGNGAPRRRPRRPRRRRGRPRRGPDAALALHPARPDDDLRPDPVTGGDGVGVGLHPPPPRPGARRGARRRSRPSGWSRLRGAGGARLPRAASRPARPGARGDGGRRRQPRPRRDQRRDRRPAPAARAAPDPGPRPPRDPGPRALPRRGVGAPRRRGARRVRVERGRVGAAAPGPDGGGAQGAGPDRVVAGAARPGRLTAAAQSSRVRPATRGGGPRR